MLPKLYDVAVDHKDKEHFLWTTLHGPLDLLKNAIFSNTFHILGLIFDSSNAVLGETFTHTHKHTLKR
jgi:hypothetical protein